MQTRGCCIWSTEAERLVLQLVSDFLEKHPNSSHTHTARLNALPINWSLWAEYYLHPCGDVIVVDEELINQPETDAIETDENLRTQIVVRGSERYPELSRLLPEQPHDAITCRCQTTPLFREHKIACDLCNSLRWVIPSTR